MANHRRNLPAMVLSDRARSRWRRAQFAAICAVGIGLNLALGFRSSATGSDQVLGVIGASAGLFTAVQFEAGHHDRWFESRWGRTLAGRVARWVLIDSPFDPGGLTTAAMCLIPFWLWAD